MENKGQPMQKLLRWLDLHGLTVLAGFLLVFIPLYPKLPLFDIIPGYIVRVRLEDFFILLTVGIWGIQLLRKKVKLHPLMTKLILAYLAIGLLSSLSAVFITKSVPMETIHIGKIFLHFFRRIEYFSLFFVFFSVVKSIKQVKIFLGVLLATMLGVALYGYGQKYLYWPVFSTMNREFSKGWKLILSEHARVPSTFGGHYDAAAFTMIVITIMLAIAWYAKNIWVKIAATITYVAGFWLLILTASRTSFIAYLLSISLVAFISMFVKKWWWPIPRYLLAMVFSLFVMLSFGDLSERFSQVLGLQKFKEQFSNTFLTAKVAKPDNAQPVDEISKVTSPSDTPPTPADPNNLPGDVYEDIPDYKPEVDEEGKYTGNFKATSRTFSENAYKYGLSAAIRLDALWPRAIAGFKKNPLLGSGYSTLTKEEFGQFTEAESTDNDFLRNLGETGILGFITFFGTVLAGIIIAIRTLPKQEDMLVKALLVGYIAGAIGLLVNAIYIDVYEASKVALTYWALTGMVVAISTLPKEESKEVTVPDIKPKKTLVSKRKKK